MQTQNQLTKLQTLIKLAIEKSKIYIDKENGILRISNDNNMGILLKSIMKIDMRNVLQYLSKALANEIICINTPLVKLKGSILEIQNLRNKCSKIILFNNLPMTEKNKVKEQFSRSEEYQTYAEEFQYQRNKFKNLMSVNHFKYDPQGDFFESEYNIELTKNNLNLSYDNICSILGFNQEFQEYLISIKEIKDSIKVDRKKGCLVINLNNSKEFIKSESLKRLNENFLAIDEILKSLRINVKKIWPKPKTISQVINFILSLRSLLEFDSYSGEAQKELMNREGFKAAQKFIAINFESLVKKIDSELKKHSFIVDTRNITSRQYHELRTENITISTIINLFSPEYDYNSRQLAYMAESPRIQNNTDLSVVDALAFWNNNENHDDLEPYINRNLTNQQTDSMFYNLLLSTPEIANFTPTFDPFGVNSL